MKDLYKLLLKAYDNVGKWWPGTSEEIVVTAVLTQNTNWRNVERALENIYKNKTKENLLEYLYELPVDYLAELIKPAGFYNLKARRLKNLLSFLKEYDFELSKIKGLKNLREKLLKINGIGKETADSILLYAFEIPVFVVDAYTKRLLKRMYGINLSEYDDVQSLFYENYPKDVKLFQELHGLIVEHSKAVCRKNPICSECKISDNCKKSI
ncbi:endonuclease-3 related protein [Thermosipho japonicus]|uniref:Endonuclease-3 related protein n=1 Tax=Thermosipho japonicus TaxID=90323 RepID=A0A841GJA8_9BACT|nr:endonuclease [Thermosipho japonicus]MBB6062095.1 endonuclease-3 related protein [Thermosipho japonicus]